MPTFHGIVWDFSVSEIADVQMDVVVHNDPPGPPSTPIAGVYFQLYDFSMFRDRPEFGGRGIYSYRGLQTNVRDPNRGIWRGQGILYSRFESSEPSDVRVATSGWPEFPTQNQIKAEGGRYIGVRNNFAWGKGSYRLRFAPTEEDADGIWYEFSATNLNTGETVSCGALRFPTIDGRRPLIPNKGTSWIEIYPHSFPLASFPEWHVTVSNVVANNGTLPVMTATTNYADDQAPALNSDISLTGPRGDVDFRVGRGVVRVTPKGTVLRLR